MSIDTTEGVGPLPTGYIEPAEQILSDEETQAVNAEYVPIRSRLDRPRIHKDGAYWMFCAPHDDKRFELVMRDGEVIKLAVKAHDTFDQACETFRQQVAIEDAKAHHADVKARLYRGDE